MLVIVLFALAFLAASGEARAEPLGSDIVCNVFTTLTELGDPIPVLDGGDCPDQPPPPPPPPPPPAACADGTDNDGDGFIDMTDPGCSDASDIDETDPEPSHPPPEPVAPECSDGLDNDGDAKVDAEDPGCAGNTDDDETDPAPPSPAPPPAGDSTGGESAPQQSGSGGGGGGSSGGGGLLPGTPLFTTTAGTSSGIVLGAATNTFSYTADEIAACDTYLTAFIRAGRVNDASQVSRLQRFLRDFEGAQLLDTGVYDGATLAAVHVFQAKYASSILAPWGIGKSTGFVYLTTRKKVNELFCRNTREFNLTPDELQKIADTRARLALESPTQVVGTKTAAPKKPPPSSAPNAAAPSLGAAGRGAFDRAFGFLRGIFR